MSTPDDFTSEKPTADDWLQATGGRITGPSHGSKCAGVVYRPKGQTIPCTHEATQGDLCEFHARGERINRRLQELHDSGDHSCCNPLVSDCCQGEDPNSPERRRRWSELEEETA